MNKKIILISLFLAGCSSAPKATYPDSDWYPVNALDTEPKAIPKAVDVKRVGIYASDRTLKNALSRIAEETGNKLSYKASNDYSLTQSAVEIQAYNMDDFLKQLRGIYPIKTSFKNKQ